MNAPVTGLVQVTRTGGYAGMTVHGRVNLARLGAEDLSAWQEALDGGFAAIEAGEPTPDRFVYRVRDSASGLDVTVGEHELPEHLRALLDAAVRRPDEAAPARPSSTASPSTP